MTQRMRSTVDGLATACVRVASLGSSSRSAPSRSRAAAYGSWMSSLGRVEAGRPPRISSRCSPSRTIAVRATRPGLFAPRSGGPGRAAFRSCCCTPRILANRSIVGWDSSGRGRWADRSFAPRVTRPAPLGTARLAAEFGGRRDDGSAPYHPRKGSRSIAREAMQQLESLGLLSKTEKKGQSISAQGRKLLDSLSHEILLELAKTNPELAKYAGGA